MSDEDPKTLGHDGTIPETDAGISVGHDPDASTFEPEEDAGPERSSTSASDRVEAAEEADPTSPVGGQGMREVTAEKQGLAEFGEDPDVETPSRDR